jgi:hypothetical protein
MATMRAGDNHAMRSVMARRDRDGNEVVEGMEWIQYEEGLRNEV